MSLESKIRALIAGANAKTGETDADLTTAVQRLMDGYGSGGGGEYDITVTNNEDGTQSLAIVDAQGGGSNEGAYAWVKADGAGDENALLLLHCEDYTDSSPSNRPITNSGCIISDNGKFGKGLQFESGGGIYVRTSISQSVFFNTDFTIDLWVNFSYLVASYNEFIVSDTTASLWLGTNGQTFIVRLYGAYDIIIGQAVPLNTWTHIAVVRSNGNMMLFQDGVLTGSCVAPTFPNCDTFIIGGTSVGNKPSGIIDELRVMRSAMWTENFTPPTAPYSLGRTIYGYVVSDDANAYPDGDYAADGYYYTALENLVSADALDAAYAEGVNGA